MMCFLMMYCRVFKNCIFSTRSSASFDREEAHVSPTLEAASIFRKASKVIRFVLALAHVVNSSGTIFGLWRTIITCFYVHNMWLLFGNANKLTREVEDFASGHLCPQKNLPARVCVVCVHPSPSPLSGRGCCTQAILCVYW